MVPRVSSLDSASWEIRLDKIQNYCPCKHQKYGDEYVKVSECKKILFKKRVFIYLYMYIWFPWKVTHVDKVIYLDEEE